MADATTPLSADTQPGEAFIEYAAGSDALPWRGWLEKDGETTGFVDLAGRVHRRTGEVTEAHGPLATRNAAWNAVRDAVFAAADLPETPEGVTDYWPRSNLACLLSLAMKELGRRLSDARGRDGAAGSALDESRLVFMLRQLEQLFAAAESFGLGVGRRASHEPPANRDFTGLEIGSPPSGNADPETFLKT